MGNQIANPAELADPEVKELKQINRQLERLQVNDCARRGQISMLNQLLNEEKSSINKKLKECKDKIIEEAVLEFSRTRKEGEGMLSRPQVAIGYGLHLYQIKMVGEKMSNEEEIEFVKKCCLDEYRRMREQEESHDTAYQGVSAVCDGRTNEVIGSQEFQQRLENVRREFD